MRKNQGVTIAALIIAIVGLSIGFAAFSNTLTIRSSATVTPDASTMRVVFSNSSSSEITGSVSPTNETSTYGVAGSIDNSTQGNSILKDLHANFTAPGQSVKYNLYVVNVGSMNGQITGVTFNNAQNASTYKKCTAVTTNKETEEIATDSLVQAACADITISVKVGQITATPTNPDLNHQILNVGASLPVEVTISYAYGAPYVDGDMDVAFGDIAINVSSAVDNSLVPTNPWVLRGVTSNKVTFGTQYVLDDSQSGDCIGYTLLDSNGDLVMPAEGGGTVPSNTLDTMGSSLKVGPDYALVNNGQSYLLYDFPQAGKMTLSIANNNLPFDKNVVASNALVTCHYTLAQS